MDNNIELVDKGPGIPPDITELENQASFQTGENLLIILVSAPKNVILNLPTFLFCPKF